LAYFHFCNTSNHYNYVLHCSSIDNWFKDIEVCAYIINGHTFERRAVRYTLSTCCFFVKPLLSFKILLIGIKSFNKKWYSINNNIVTFQFKHNNHQKYTYNVPSLPFYPTNPIMHWQHQLMQDASHLSQGQAKNKHKEKINNAKVNLDLVLKMMIHHNYISFSTELPTQKL